MRTDDDETSTTPVHISADAATLVGIEPESQMEPEKTRDSGCYDSDAFRSSPTASERSSHYSAGLASSHTDESGIHMNEYEEDVVNDKFAVLVEKYGDVDSPSKRLISKSKFNSARSVFEKM